MNPRKHATITCIGLTSVVAAAVSASSFLYYNRRYDSLPSEVERVFTLRKALSHERGIEWLLDADDQTRFEAMAVEEQRLSRDTAVASGVESAIRYSRRAMFYAAAAFASVGLGFACGVQLSTADHQSYR